MIGDFFRAVQEFLANAHGDPLLPAYLIFAFLAFGCVFLSPWFLVLQTGLLLPAPEALVVALVGLNLSAFTFFGVGRAVGERALRRFFGARVEKIVADRGFESVFLLRLLPVLPFTLVNLSVGAFGVSPRNFVLATTVGLLPLTLAVVVLGDRVSAVIQAPTLTGVATLVGTVVAFGVGVLWLRRQVKRSQAASAVAP